MRPPGVPNMPGLAVVAQGSLKATWGLAAWAQDPAAVPGSFAGQTDTSRLP